MRKYRITVAHRGKHLFTTDHINDPYNRGSDEFAARQLYVRFCRDYPAADGYYVSLGYAETIVHSLDVRWSSNG